MTVRLLGSIPAIYSGQLVRRARRELARDATAAVGVTDASPRASERLTPLIRQSGVLPAASVDFLATRLDSLSDAWGGFNTELQTGAIHGDSKIANLMRTPEGPLIMDLDHVRVAPWEWDLATISRRAHDGWSAEEWPAFSAGYGHDLLFQSEAEPLGGAYSPRGADLPAPRHQSPHRLRRGRSLLDQWVEQPDRGCHELDWEGVFRRFPDPVMAGS